MSAESGFSGAESERVESEITERSASELLEDEEALKDYTVVTFGTGGDKAPEDKIGVASARRLGKLVTGEMGMSGASGGFDVGAIKAYTEGLTEGLQERGKTDQSEEYIYSIPLGKDVIDLPSVQGATTESISILPDRKAALQKKGSAFIAVAGSAGTFDELLSTMTEEGLYARANRPEALPYDRPIIIVDPTLRHTDSIRAIARVNGEKAKAVGKLGPTYVVNDDADVVKSILETYYLMAHKENLSEEDQQELGQRLQDLEQYKLTAFLDENKINEEGGGI